MRYTIISAEYTNQEHDAATIMTEEAAAVAISQADTPEIWQQMLDTVTVTPYAEPIVEESEA